MMPTHHQNGDTNDSKKATDKPRCGLVMPISAIDGCAEAHWADVKSVLGESLEQAGFQATLVSEANDVGIIQKRIIHNLYENPLVVCDVSGKNPNVMFELGLRLAFDKPTIIVKDDKTSYSFDTAPIEHLEYPRDLRFGKIVDFKKALGEKAKATYEAGKKDGYTTFLKHFGKFTVAKLETSEISKEEYILEELRELRRAMSRRDEVRDRDAEGNRRVELLAQAMRDFALKSPEKSATMRSLLEDAEFRNFLRDQYGSSIGLRSAREYDMLAIACKQLGLAL